MESSKQVGAMVHQEAVEAPPDLIYDGLRVQLRPTSFFIRTLALAVDYGLIYIAILSVVAVAFLALFGGTLSLGYFTQSGNTWGSTAGVLLLVVVLLVFFGGIMGLTHGYFIYYEYKKN